MAVWHRLFIFNHLPSPLQYSLGTFPLIHPLYAWGAQDSRLLNFLLTTWILTTYERSVFMGFQAFTRSSGHKTQAIWPPGAPYQIGLAKPRSSASSQSGVLFLSFFASLSHSTESVHHVPCSVECCLFIPLLCLTPPHAAWPPFPMPCWLYAVFCSPVLCYLTPHGLTNTLCALLNSVFSLFFTAYSTSHSLATMSHVVFVTCCHQMPCYCSTPPHRS